MINSLVLTPLSTAGQESDPFALTDAQIRLRQVVLDSVKSQNSKRNYGKALDSLFRFCASQPLYRETLLAWKASMDGLSPSTINVRLSAARKLISEARKMGLLTHEDAANLTDVPNIVQKGSRMGNWLTREQAKEILRVPDRKTNKGKRDYVVLGLLVGCALRRWRLASLKIEDIQERENRWVIVDTVGKGKRLQTVAVPVWIKKGVEEWKLAAGITRVHYSGRSTKRTRFTVNP